MSIASGELAAGEAQTTPHHYADDGRAKRRFDWRTMLGNKRSQGRQHGSSEDTSDIEQEAEKRPGRWNMGMLNDRETEEVPGSVLLLSKYSDYNEPLGLRNAPARTSASSLPSRLRSHSGTSSLRRRVNPIPEKKRTADGKFVLEPQPDDSVNDPLNWEVWRRDASLFSLGFYCMVGGGMTPILAAGFNNVASDYGVSEPRVALTTGLYMMGLGLGSVVLSPTAILYGKRPVYLVASICFVLSGVWCALSPNFASLVCARIFQGFAVSSVECLPSATIAEIYFLHEKGYRLGIYTLLLLGGKNLVPLVSAAIIESLGWRWVFWVVAIVVAFAGFLLFLFVPETFWDRTPVPRRRRSQGSLRHHMVRTFTHSGPPSPTVEEKPQGPLVTNADGASNDAHPIRSLERHAHFDGASIVHEKSGTTSGTVHDRNAIDEPGTALPIPASTSVGLGNERQAHQGDHYITRDFEAIPIRAHDGLVDHPMQRTNSAISNISVTADPRNQYTRQLDSQTKQAYLSQLKPWSGRLSQDRWLKAAIRPFILFAYPSILWSTLVYSLSIGWLIVISESITLIYKSRDTYGFTSLQAGLVYISPFVGGILGTAVAGKCSDIVVRYMARRNGGIYEPEFRLIMAIPITFTTVIGLMGYGWSAQERDAWIVPTIFFGITSFGCSLGSTTSITFAVDSYRQYAGEALVTLNFSKNILHGLVWSLFFVKWLDAEGSKDVFIAIGGVQLACLLTTIPMYIYGKRCRMWTVRKNLMEKF